MRVFIEFVAYVSSVIMVKQKEKFNLVCAGF